MDFQTIIINFGGLNIVSGLLLLGLFVNFKEINATKYWAIGGLMVGAGAVLLALRGLVPDIFSISLANTLLFFGFAFHCKGFHQHLVTQKFSHTPFIVSAFSSVVFFVLTEPEHLDTRILFSSYTLTFLYLCSAYSLIKGIGKQSFFINLVGLNFIIASATHIYRIYVYTLYNVNEIDFIKTTQLANFFVFSIGSISTTIFTAGCIFLVSLDFQRKTNENLLALQLESKEKSRFLAMLGHEIKTPLSVLKSLLGTKSLNEDFFRLANESVDEIKSIITASQLSDQIENKSFKLNIEEISITNLIDEILERYDHQKRISTDSFGSENLTSDYLLLKVSIRNIVENALKYSAKDSQINIRFENNERSNYWRFSITNKVSDASGIDAKRIFDKYYRGKTAHSQSGSGLGLYIVKGFTELLNGSVNAELNDNYLTIELTFERMPG